MSEYYSPENLEKIKKLSIYTFTCQGPPPGEEGNMICRTCTDWRAQYGAESKRKAVEKFRKDGGIIGADRKIQLMPGCLYYSKKYHKRKEKTYGGSSKRADSELEGECRGGGQDDAADSEG